MGPTNSSLYPQSGFMQMCLCGGGGGLSEKAVQEVKLIQSWRQTGTVTGGSLKTNFPSPSYTLGGNAFLSWYSHHGRQNGGFSEN